MRLLEIIGASLALVLTSEASSKSLNHRHDIFHRRLHEHRAQSHSHNLTADDRSDLRKRGTCAFPTGLGLVPVAPNGANGGWAMSPDQPCMGGNYCPYACPPGQVSMQWNPAAVAYTYPLSMDGGLYCNYDGTVSKPFPDRPYCQTTATNINVINNAGSSVAICQTVLPGNEAMLIPTHVDTKATLANPDTSYWAGTAAHYYVNPPGVSTAQGCVWGTSANPWGNWSPYVLGANTDTYGITYIKIGWNPIYLELATPFRNVMPTWGISVECPNGGCSGLPCAIDPTQNSVNTMVGGTAVGAGGGTFCVIGVSKGSIANFVITESSSSSSSNNNNNGTSSNSNSNNNALDEADSDAGGQFYTAAAPSASSNTTSTTAGSAASATSWAGWSSNSTSQGTSGSQMSGTAAGFGASTTGLGSASSATPTLISPSILPATGDGSRIDISAATVMSLMFAGWMLS